ncbi:conserved Plasmodium protein, unknown function [Plasmodium knowlesi strain H]|uniref:Uncharacterized protein n=3 Tax=Plasmodium knowlesi TaxID=5850 RepID=A0A5K1TWG4_PLAKH|nr:uncharacterized protein PKNH_0109500 [Plasmodium knowlesi strain H]OTN68714.1 Uncharacterized protein PKNOH_S01017800 [Plasmodium knowlesi]CAA9986175.1 protein transport protein USE1, putative [Plasmodium knowlesi strain H]SBO25372.1 conserved Plasmodium protein, unknown function [Plasmodium knowlesi strain H]SBO27669.1 conserved Plasmodium protein, unknown function [Plasmodium knowlesi strain H]VVS75649.1 protein transport protein USE1, putative [Plasmodium knowlesi strain H]|eukprot:XP_002257586.1 [Plasmodium knowlesi strain H]
MIAFDEIFEFLREAEITCDNFNEQNEEHESIILFLNELKSYITDLSLSLKDRINAPDDITEQDILKKIINKKESLEWILRRNRDNFLGGVHSEGISSPLIFGKGTNHDDLSSSTNRANPDDRGKDGNYDIRGNSDVDNPTGETLPPRASAQMNNECATTSEKVPPTQHAMGKNVGGISDTCSKANVVQKDHQTPSHSLSCAKRGYNKVEESLSKEDQDAPVQSERKESYDGAESLNDEVLKEWSEQIDEYDNLLYEYSFAFKKNDWHKKMKSRKNMNKSGENIDEELCLLAQEMKENVLTYRDIIVEDNMMLEQSANKQRSNLDNITDVYKKTKKMGESKNISFFVSLLIIAASALLCVLTFFVILIL